MGPVGLAVTYVGDADRGGTVDDVIVGEHLAIWGEHHASASASRLAVADRGVDVHQSGGNARGDGRGVRRPGPARYGAGRGRPAGQLAESSGRRTTEAAARA